MVRKTMGRPERLRDLIDSAIEAYTLAAQPPANDYTRKIDPTTAMSRPSMLMLGIDVKYIIFHQLSALPRTQAQNVIDWVQDGSNFAQHALTDYHQQLLKININNIKQILIANGYK